MEHYLIIHPVVFSPERCGVFKNGLLVKAVAQDAAVFISCIHSLRTNISRIYFIKQALHLCVKCSGRVWLNLEMEY